MRLNRKIVVGGGLLAALLFAGSSPLDSHEIPSDVTVRVFVKPEGQRLRLLVRAPLEAMRDFEFPQYGQGYLDVAAAGPMLSDAAVLWIADYLQFFENGAPLGDERVVAARVSIPSDRSFAGYETALAHVNGPPLADGLDLRWDQALLDVLFEVPIGSETSEFSLDSQVSHLGLRTTTVLHFLPPGGAERVFQYSGDPGLVRLDPRWHQAALRFVALGFQHILDGIDHLLFLLCLIIPVRRIRTLVPIVTAFTVAHSITLIASAMGLAPRGLWFPPFVETLIALSIVYMAFENIVGVQARRRWLIAFGFGLVHGFGFSFALSETLQFAGSHLLMSLLSFNVGVELGQLVALVVAVPVLRFLFDRVVAPRMGVILLSALIAHTSWHWMTDRWATLRAYDVRWPGWDASAGRWMFQTLMVLLIIAATLWLFGMAVRWFRVRFPAPGPEPEGRPPPMPSASG